MGEIVYSLKEAQVVIEQTPEGRTRRSAIGRPPWHFQETSNALDKPERAGRFTSFA